ncbi:MAG: ABC transporter substrate-binding protein [Hyphomicrobiaceae bacterium]
MAIVLQESLRGLFYAPFYAALALDAYGKEGLDVRFVSAPEPGRAATNLWDGGIDVTWGGPMRVMQTYAQRADCDIVCFAEVVTRDPFLLVGREARPAFRLSELKALRLASVSEVPTPWMCLQQDLRDAGLDPTALQRVATNSMAENVAALARGDVDVIQIFEPLVESLVASGGGHVWYAQACRGPTSYTTLYARRGTLERQRDACLKMTRALHRTLGWVHDVTPERLADVVAPYFPDVSARQLAGALARYKALGIWGQDTVLPRSGYERLRTSLESGGFVAKGADYAEAVDNSLAEQVIAETPLPLEV